MRARHVVVILALLMPLTVAVSTSPAGAALPDAALASTHAPLTAVLDGASEVPGPGDPDGTGLGTVTIDAAHNQLCYELSKITNLDTPTAAHIHKGAAGVAGPIVQPFTPPATGDGTTSSNACLTPADPTLISSLETDPAGFYVNIHTSAFPGGAIRGQLGAANVRSAATMNGLNEQTGAGVNDNGDKDGAGRAIVWTNTAQSTVCLNVQVIGIDPTNAGHIHRAAAGSNGPIAVPFDDPTDGMAYSCNTSPTDASTIASNPKAYYVNVHNAAFPAGALRGQLAPAGAGYRLIASDGGVFGFGQGTFAGSRGGQKNNAAFVGGATTMSREGYWLAAADGGIFSFGDAPFFGSTGGQHINAPIVGMVGTSTGKGYWLVAADGGIFTFGDAPFFGSTGSMKLNKPIIGMAATPTGKGYWLFAGDGGIFTFGDAGFFGSTGGRTLNKPVVGMAATGLGQGYWLVASDGGIFTFGDAGFFGSTGSQKLNKPIVAMLVSPSGQGYLVVGSDGGIFTFGDAEFSGSTGSLHLQAPVVAVTQ